MKIPIILILSLILLLSACSVNDLTGEVIASENNEDNFQKRISIEETQKLIEEEKPLIIDIRTPEEYNQGHLEGAININFYENTFYKEIKEIETEKPILIYCRSASRSGKAMKGLKGQLENAIYEMKDGIIAWQREGGELVK